jgi:A/G-specific adenine glycosylase
MIPSTLMTLEFDSRTRSLFRRGLLRWYDANKRDLPWRQDRDPYRVWISEIMLQQTRVAAVIEYYRRFLKRFPTVQALMAATLSSVLTAWSGLGYYRRARALHQAAKVIVNEYAGRFPKTADELRALPGIGRYTAAAIASIAFDEPAAVVDGNVERVLGRLLGRNLDREEAWSTAGQLLSRSRPGDFNQALMELGATVCLPKDPKCLMCPVVKFCSRRGELPKDSVEVRRKREVYYALNQRDGDVLLVERAASLSLMPGMWELPEIAQPNGEHPVSFTLRHSITVTDYVVRVSSGSAPEVPLARWIKKSRLVTLPLTGLTRKILQRANII